jgi:hypothetical protein
MESGAETESPGSLAVVAPATGAVLLQRLELRQLNASVARVGDIKTVGGIDPESLGTDEFAHFLSGLAKGSQRATFGIVNVDEGDAERTDVDVAVAVGPQTILAVDLPIKTVG